jgi:hypothetical protein
MLMMNVPLGRAQAVAVTITLKTPSGSLLTNSPLRVYQDPFEMGSSYQMQQLASGVTDSAGKFVFSPPTQSEPELNVLISAVAANKSWMAQHYAVLGSGVSANLTVIANVNVSTAIPGAGSATAASLATHSTTSCEAAGDPDGADPAAADFQADPDGPEDTYLAGTYQTLGPCLLAGGGTTPSSGSESGESESSYSTDADGSSSHVNEVKRWVRIANHHNAPGMKSTFTLAKGRDTTTHVATKVGFGGWYVGGWATETSSRTATRSKTVDSGFHRVRAAKYVFYKYRIIHPEYVVTFWKPHHWTGGLRRSSTAVAQDPRLSANDIQLGVNDVFSKQSRDNINYNAGFQLVGLSLNAQTGYTTITKLRWTGTKSGCNKWLYGKNTDPVEAREVQAKSNC